MRKQVRRIVTDSTPPAQPKDPDRCTLVAPVRVGKDAYVAAGSSIVEDVPAGALGIARGRQINKPGWVAEKKRKR